jgi:hypothetical protein
MCVLLASNKRKMKKEKSEKGNGSRVNGSIVILTMASRIPYPFQDTTR